jgi:hypothetical protein
MRVLLAGSLLAGALSLIGCDSDSGVAPSPDGGSGGAAADSGASGAGGSTTASGGKGGASGAGGSAGDSNDGGVESGASAEASEGGEDAGESGSGDSGTPAKAGFIGVTSRATAVATVFANSVSAGFFDGPGNSYALGCQREVVGACSVLLCDFTNGGAATPPTGPATSAGTIAVGGTSPTFSVAYDAVTLQYGAVPAVPTDKLLFGGGDTITFTAAGGDVPAFAASVLAPAPITVTSPVLPGDALSIDSSKDLVFAWTGSSVGRIAFNVRTTTSSATTTVSSSFVSCQFDVSTLTGTLPTALLQKLRKTDAATTATLGTDLSNTREVVAGDYSVHLAVGSVATKADGKTQYAAGKVTIL